uniref:Uncharacterized protein n=1 Tax=Tanacetum cinerariifolium TaxID=118510 RepID=A0A699IJQ8_TANCI|nr:hypothetical protein [Tanacetum cinerariifolium]
MVNVATDRENVGSKVVQQSGIQCFNCKEYGRFAKECRKPKRVKDFVYHKEKMLMCKQAKQGVQLQAEQYDWLANTDEEVDEQELKAYYSYMAKIQELEDMDEKVDEQELEAHYSYMAKIQEVPTADSGTDSDPVEQNEQNDVENDDERVALANLIANLKLDVDENKKIHYQLKKANTTLAQELKECKAILAETSKSLGESINVRDSFERKLNEALGQLAHKDTVIREGLKTKAYELLVVKEKHDELMKQSLLTKSHYEGLVKQKMKIITYLKVREERDIEKMFSMEKQLKFLNEIVYKRSQSIQTIHMMAPKVSTYNGRPTFANPKYLKQAQSEISCTKKHTVGPISTRKPKSQANKSTATTHTKKVSSKSTKQKLQCYFRVLYENTNKAWKWWIERQSPSGYKWVPKPKKQWVPKAKMQWVPKAKNDQAQKRIVQLILFIVDSGCTKHMTGNLKLLCNFVEKFLGTVRFGNDQFAPTIGYGDLVQGNVMINRVYYVEGLNHNLFLVGQFCDTDLEATPTQAWLWHQRLSYLNFDCINLLSKKDIMISLPKLKYVKDQLCSSCELSKANRSSFKSKAVSSSKGRLNLLHMDLCGPMQVASINGKKYILVIVDDYSRYT